MQRGRVWPGRLPVLTYFRIDRWKKVERREEMRGVKQVNVVGMREPSPNAKPLVGAPVTLREQQRPVWEQEPGEHGAEG